MTRRRSLVENIEIGITIDSGHNLDANIGIWLVYRYFIPDTGSGCHRGC